MERNDIFISYSRADLEKVKAIKTKIEQNTGVRCWMDLEGIESGDQFEKVIISAIIKSDTFLFMLSKNSMNSEWTLDEIDFAKKKGKRLVIVAIEDVQMEDVFYFRYHKYDQICWGSEAQRNKLFRDIKNWKKDADDNRNKKESVTEVKEEVARGEVDSEGVVIKTNKRKKKNSETSFFRKFSTSNYAKRSRNKYFVIGGIAVFVILLFFCGGIVRKQKGAENYDIARVLLEKEDTITALEYLERSIRLGNPTAMAEMGVCYFKGNGELERDSLKAYQLFKRAADKKDAIGQHWLGYLYEKGYYVQKDSVKAFDLYKRSAQQGNAQSMSRFGRCYDYGIGVECNKDTAIYWYKKSAELGNKYGQAELAQCYQYGVGVKKDTIEAMKWYEKAASQNFIWAMDKVASNYYYGYCVEKDEKKAFKWYMKMADLGNSKGMYYVGRCYYEGAGVLKDREEAYNWYLKSAQKGYDDAQDALGDIYHEKQDYKSALEWYIKAADQNNKSALCSLGFYYFFGWGIKADSIKAVQYWEESMKPIEYDSGYSIRLDSESAQYNLGLCYENGWGCEKNLLKSNYWYNRAKGVEIDSAIVEKK